MSVRSLRERMLGLRDRLLANPGFQRWAAGFPLTRPIAARRARALFDLCAGFVYSQVLASCVRLRLCDILMDGPRSAEQLADQLSLPIDNMERLLEAATALRLTERRVGGRYGVGPLGAALVGNPAIAAMVAHHGLLYGDLRDPVALLRGEAMDTALSRHWPYARGQAQADLAAAEVGPYSDLMAASQPLVAADILAAYRLDRHRCLLDIGGGDGSFLRSVAEVAPGLQLILFDLPAVAERARAKFAAAGLADRARAVGGDFHTDSLPDGADIISLVRVIHDHDDAAARMVLRAVHDALPPGGTLLLAEPMADTSGAGGVAAYFSFYLLAMGSGRPRPASELRQMLRQVGFSSVNEVSTRRPMLVRLLIARRSV